MKTAYIAGGSNPVAGGAAHPIHITRSDGETLPEFEKRVTEMVEHLKTIPGNHDANYRITYEE